MARRPVVIDSSDESADDSDSSSSRPSNGLVDDEAIDVDDSDAGSSADTTEISASDQFHQFMKLPVEIRRHIWDIICPDIADKHPRVLPLSVDSTPTSSGNVDGNWTWQPALATEDQTEPVRKLGSIHHETREIVTKAFPDVLALNHGWGCIRFDSDRDIIFVDNGMSAMVHGTLQAPKPGMCDKIRHICFDLGLGTLEARNGAPTEEMITYLTHMPSLETAMIGLNPFPNDGQYHFKGWVAEQQTVEARLNTYQKSEGLGEDLEWAFVWPDFKKHPDFLEHQVNTPWLNILPDDFKEFLVRKGAKFAPMLVFDFDHRWYLDTLKERYANKIWNWDEVHAGVTDEDESSNYEDEDDDENEYESDGINDDTIEQWDDQDEDELIPPPVSPPGGAISVYSSDSESSNTEDGLEAGVIVHSPQVGNFSSPDPESGNNDELVVPRRPKRRIVSDSDDDEDDDEPAAKRTKTRARLISSDEEEDQDVQPRSRGGSRGAPQVISDDDSSEDSSSDEDAAPPKKLSLQQRLGSVSNNNPEPEDEDDNSDDENSFCSYANSDDEGEDDEDSEEEGGVVDSMAADTDDDDGDGDGDDGW